MEILLLTVGKTTRQYVKDGIEDFSTRLKRYIQYSIVCLPDVKTSKALSESVQKEKEGESILGYLNPSDYVVILDEHGREYTSVEFASFISKTMLSGRKRLIFVVGRPYGFSPKVYERADSKISLSKMTFTHEMVRMFFTEQVYRAMTILRGEPYHHE